VAARFDAVHETQGERDVQHLPFAAEDTGEAVMPDEDSLQQQCEKAATFYEEKPGLQGPQAIIDLYRVCAQLASRVQELEASNEALWRERHG